MVNTLLKIELEKYSDDKTFEELAFDIIMESYPNAERRGGTHDLGIDAEETLHYGEQRIERKYQFSIEKNPKEKIKKTIARYAEAAVYWDELVYVSNRHIDAGSTKTWFFETYHKKLIICDQQVIDYVLTNNSVLWKKHFPTIPMPIDIYDDRLANEQLHENMLKCSLLFASHKYIEVDKKRSELFEQYILSLALTSNEKAISYSIASQKFHAMFHKTLTPDYFRDAIEGLIKNDLLHPKESEEQIWEVSEVAINAIKNEETEIENGRENLVNDIVKDVKRQLQNIKISQEETSQIKCNVKNVLNKFFQLYGTDFAIKIDQKILSEFRKQEILKDIAGDKLDTHIAETILYAIGKIIESPTENQRHTLSLLSKSCICAQIMQIDPLLSDCQAEVLREKIFILDTDVVLHSIVPESPNYELYQQMINALVEKGCIVCVPQSVVDEVIVHAESSFGNYKRFKASYSTNDKSTLKEDYRNVFVDGFFVANAQDSLISFDNYISNYYDKEEPLSLILDVMNKFLAKRVIICKDDIWNNDINIPDDEIEDLARSLLIKTLDTLKAEHRGDAGNELIARNDALIYLTAYHMSKNTNHDQRGMLSQRCYIITTSTRTIKCAKEKNLFKSVVTKPLILISILSELGLFDEGYDVVDLLGNPFLAKIASENWEDLEKLAKLGVDLRGKMIPRLLRDLKDQLHVELTNKINIEINAEDSDITLVPPRDEMQDYIDFVHSVEDAGYNMMPGPAKIVKAYRVELEKNKQKDIEIATLKHKKKKKEKNKQRYEQNYAAHKMK